MSEISESFAPDSGESEEGWERRVTVMEEKTKQGWVELVATGPDSCL